MIDDKLTDARRRKYRRTSTNFNCADAVSRIASDIAAKAAMEARNEHCGCYSYLHNKICSAKQELADKSVESARIAQSNLASKLALVNELSEEKQTVSCILHELLLSKQQLEEAINKEIESIAAAKTLQDLLAKALQVASEVAVSADVVVSSISSDIEVISKILELENANCHQLCHKEHIAKLDVEATRIAEKKAVMAATNAKENVFKTKRQQPPISERYND